MDWFLLMQMNRFLSDLAATNRSKIYYGISEDPDPNCETLETKQLSSKSYIKAAFRDTAQLVNVNTNLVGDYNFNNVMTAVSIGRYFKVPADKIKKAIEAYIPANNRSQILEKETNTFLLDAYNANPDSMRKSLENFAQMEAPDKIAVIGDMLELGTYSDEEHKSIIELAASLSFKQLIVVGAEFGKVYQSVDKVLHFDTVELLSDWYNDNSFKDTFFLLKGSRGIGLEKMINS